MTSLKGDCCEEAQPISLGRTAVRQERHDDNDVSEIASRLSGMVWKREPVASIRVFSVEREGADPLPCGPRRPEAVRPVHDWLLRGKGRSTLPKPT